MNIIIPIVGNSKQNSETEYIKSLQEIEQKTIIQYAFEAVQNVEANHFIVVVKREDVTRFHIDNIVKLLRTDTEVVIAEGQTQGAACTCMLTVDKLDMEQPLLILGSDQILDLDLNEVITEFNNKDYDAGVVIFDDVHPRRSYVRVDENGHVIEAAEKRPISHHATAGVYYFKNASSFFKAAEKMILKNASVNGQFFICPVLNEMILEQKVIGVYQIEKTKYFNFSHSSGVEAYREYLKNRNEKV